VQFWCKIFENQFLTEMHIYVNMNMSRKLA